jgi:ribulose-5-phosphate 4-epimerase/fuculose-1-phosphate aldolase
MPDGLERPQPGGAKMSAIVKSLSSTAAEEAEWALRVDMAAVFRVSARLGWNEQIGNHNSIMLPKRTPDEAPTFLINPRGWRFEELTASSLIVCDLDGNVLRGTGELRKVAFFIHARIHMQNPAATCVLHVHPQYLTALALLEEPEVTLSHFNDLLLADRTAFDLGARAGASTTEEGDRLAAALGDKSILIMGSHGVTVVGPDIASAFDELHQAERTMMYHMTALATGKRLRRLPEESRRHYTGAWGDKVDARMHLDAWRRMLDKEGSDYAT